MIKRYDVRGTDGEIWNVHHEQNLGNIADVGGYNSMYRYYRNSEIEQLIIVYHVFNTLKLLSAIHSHRLTADQRKMLCQRLRLSRS
mgnify:CR=1 FL=1